MTSDRIRRQYHETNCRDQTSFAARKTFRTSKYVLSLFCGNEGGVVKIQYLYSTSFSRHERMFCAADDFERTEIACCIEDSFEYGGNQIGEYRYWILTAAPCTTNDAAGRKK